MPLLFAVCLLLGCGTEPAIVDPSDLPNDTLGSVCVPGSQLCNGDDLLICVPSGDAYTPIACEIGCMDNACRSAECDPNTQRCIGPKLAEYCDESGLGHQIVCDFGCLNGECSEIICSAGLLFCEPDGDKIQRCSPEGLNITEMETCPFGCDAATATCLDPACFPGDLRCSPTELNRVEICADDQRSFEPTDILCEESCQDGHCLVQACTPGSMRCGGTGVETCNAQGSAYTQTEACQWGCVANQDQGLAQCATCPPGLYGCIDQTVVYCEAPHLPWATVQTCPDIDSCVAGVCVKAVTLTGNPQSGSMLLLLVEAMADCWTTMEKAAKEEDVCRAIDTTGLEGDIPKSAIGDWFCSNAGDGIGPKDFSDANYFVAAKELLGCGWFDLADLTINTVDDKIHAGLSQVECIGYEENEIVVAPCETFQ
jgi:hypothetical protein